MKKTLYKSLVVILSLIVNYSLNGQPSYTPIELISEFDTTGLNQYFPKEKYNEVSFKVLNVDIHDSDDNNETPIKFNGSFLIANASLFQTNDSIQFIEQFVFSEDKKEKFLISKQQFLNSLPNGKFEHFSLKGMRIGEVNFKKGKQRGISRFYGVDGIEIIEEVEYINDEKTIQREYYPNGNIKQEFPYEKTLLNGVGKRYYETGNIMEEVQFTDGEFNGDYKYFHPNNQIWVHIEYKLGKPYNAILNSTANGKKRPPGTLKNGNGTLIYYNENDSIDETQHFQNGIRVK